MSYSIMKEQARRVARKAAVRYWDWRDRPVEEGWEEWGREEGGRECVFFFFSLSIHPSSRSRSLALPFFLSLSLTLSLSHTSRVALADQFVGQDGDAQEVDGLRHDKQVVVVLDDQPEEAEELRRRERWWWWVVRGAARPGRGRSTRRAPGRPAPASGSLLSPPPRSACVWATGHGATRPHSALGTRARARPPSWRAGFGWFALRPQGTGRARGLSRRARGEKEGPPYFFSRPLEPTGARPRDPRPRPHAPNSHTPSPRAHQHGCPARQHGLLLGRPVLGPVHRLEEGVLDALGDLVRGDARRPAPARPGRGAQLVRVVGVHGRRRWGV